MPRAEIKDFRAAHLEEAANLLASRHRAHRDQIPVLSERFGDPTHASREIAYLLEKANGDAVVSFIGGKVVGYMVGVEKDAATWGENAWVESAGYAAVSGTVVQDLYAHSAERWMGSGKVSQYVLVPALSEFYEVWFQLGFGMQQIHAAMGPDDRRAAPGGPRIRRAVLSDIDDLVRLDLEMPRHLRGSPVFSRIGLPGEAELREEWVEGTDDPEFCHLVVESDAQVVGVATGCSVDKSSSNISLIRPDNAGLLGFAAVDADARGRGFGRILGDAIVDWGFTEGYGAMATDWRSTNLSASRTWPRVGFQPTFYRLHRAII